MQDTESPLKKQAQQLAKAGSYADQLDFDGTQLFAALEGIRQHFKAFNTEQRDEFITQTKTTDVISRIERIKQICEERYSGTWFSGHAALNRAIFLDKDIKDEITPDVILVIFAEHEKYLENGELSLKDRFLKFQPVRNEHPAIRKGTSLADTFYFAIKDHQNLKCFEVLSNNAKGLKQKVFENYLKRKKDFENNATAIFGNIKSAAAKLDIHWPNRTSFNKKTKLLTPTYLEIIDQIDNLYEQLGEKCYLLRTSHDDTHIPSECKGGLEHICGKIHGYIDSNTHQITDGTNTLDDFDALCQQIAKSDLLLDEHFGHNFYDRLHLQCCLQMEQLENRYKDTHWAFKNNAMRFNMKGTYYSLTALIKGIVKEIDEHPDDLEYAIAREQFDLRLDLVLNEIKRLELKYKVTYTPITTTVSIQKKNKELQTANKVGELEPPIENNDLSPAKVTPTDPKNITNDDQRTTEPLTNPANGIPACFMSSKKSICHVNTAKAGGSALGAEFGLFVVFGFGTLAKYASTHQLPLFGAESFLGAMQSLKDLTVSHPFVFAAVALCALLVLTIAFRGIIFQTNSNSCPRAEEVPTNKLKTRQPSA